MSRVFIAVDQLIDPGRFEIDELLKINSCQELVDSAAVVRMLRR